MVRLILDHLKDIRFALRQYRRSPGFVLLAVLTLAFGVGATTGVYTVVHAVLLRPLPFADSDSLVMAWDNAPQDGDRFKAIMASPEDFREYSRSSKLLERIASAARIRPVLHKGDLARRSVAGLVTVSMFRDTLGSKAWLGRVFVDDDQQAGCIVVLAYRFWTRVLDGDASLVGRNLRFDHTDCAVVGIMPVGFDLFPIEAEMWFLRDHAPAGALETARRAGYLDRGIIYARLKHGATPAQAEVELTGLHRNLYATGPSLSPNNGGERGRVVAVTPVRSAVMGVVSPSLGTSLWLAFGSVVLLLLIACVNVANLLLARLTDRHRELVVRSALGSGRARLIRQMLTEGAVLAAAGIIPGVALAWAGVRWFRYMSPFPLPTQTGEISLNIRVLFFSVGISFATTLLFTLLPALAGSRLDLSQNLRSAGRGFFGSAGRLRTAQMLVGGEMALSFVLLTSAALLMSSVARLEREQLGFDIAGIATAYGELPGNRYPTRESREAFERSLRERAEALSGVSQVVFGSFPPNSNGGQSQIEVQGRAIESVFDVEVIPASREYFELLHVPMLRGRRFTDSDKTGPALAIVSQRFVDEYFKDGDAIGRSIRLIDGDTRGDWKTIVGVVGNWKHMVNNTAWRDTAVVFSIGGMPENVTGGYGVGVAVRTGEDVGLVATQLQRQISALEPNAILQDLDVPTQRLNAMLTYPRFRAVLLFAFGVGALLLAAIGLYGVNAQLVAQRLPEFGVRRAVGAQTRDLVWLVVRQGGIGVALGLIAGLAGAFATGRLIKGMLYGVEIGDAQSLVAATLVLIMSAALGMLLPALRAARVDPMAALRQE